MVFLPDILIVWNTLVAVLRADPPAPGGCCYLVLVARRRLLLLLAFDQEVSLLLRTFCSLVAFASLRKFQREQKTFDSFF